MSKVLLPSAALCFLSFAWGMACHFRRIGPPTRPMLLTALLAIVFASAQLIAMGRRPLRFPAAALALYAVSAALFWWAVSVTRRKLAACGQRCVSSEVVIRGPYRFIRHPFYAAYNLAWLAGFIATAWWPFAIGTLAMAALYDFFAREEELGFSASHLAADYAAYRRATGKYLPFQRARSIPD